MCKLLQENYMDFIDHGWHGIVVAIPKSEYASQYDSELYLYSRYWTRENGIEYHRVDYNKEDSELFATCIVEGVEYELNCFDEFDIYVFDDLKEFCKWYIKQDS